MSLPAAYLAKSSPSPYRSRAGLSCAPLARLPTTFSRSPKSGSTTANRWRHAAKLLLDQADVADVSRQVHLALFYDANLDINAMSR